MAKPGAANTIDAPRAERIARLNDELRTTGAGGSVMITANLRRVTGFDPVILADALSRYEGFDRDNDPHGERISTT